MIILPDFEKPYIIDEFHSPILPKHFWIFSASLFDFTLAPLSFIEETSSALVKIMVDGFQLLVPYNWHIIVTDPYTNTLDSIPVHECSAVYSFAMVMATGDSKVRSHPIQVLDIIENGVEYHPVLQKNTGLCYPIATEKTRLGHNTPLSIVITPYDLSKQMADKSIADLL
jgi:hypothetical protein